MNNNTRDWTIIILALVVSFASLVMANKSKTRAELTLTNAQELLESTEYRLYMKRRILEDSTNYYRWKDSLRAIKTPLRVYHEEQAKRYSAGRGREGGSGVE